MTSSPSDADARADWERRIGRRSDDADGAAPVLDPPASVTAVGGRGQVTVSWSEVSGAIGYQVYAADGDDGELEPLDHAGRDVLAVPHPPYVDTTGRPGGRRRYAVTALSDVEVEGPMSAQVAASPTEVDAGPVAVRVDATGDESALRRPWRPMIGSEHLSHALSTDRNGGRVIGADLTAALRAAQDELGVRTVRAHGILCDDLGVYREVDGQPVHDFSGIDRVYDHIRSLGLRPIVELSFMPRDLASDPTKTVFAYDAIVSPPKDWDRWRDLIVALVSHLVDRYGLEEVRDHWAFEVWNEANLEVFWSGTQAEYWRLYDLTAEAVTSVHPALRVGGPASAAAGWVERLFAHVDGSGARVDFVTTHTYGSPPLDFRPTLERYGRAGMPIWWTEWGVTPTHFNEVSDAVFAGVFLLRGMASAMGRLESLSYWVVSDHFEELGRPPALLHGGFGLRTVGELRKPRWWALALLERLGSVRLPAQLEGDGAGSLVEALAARDDDAGRDGDEGEGDGDAGRDDGAGGDAGRDGGSGRVGVGRVGVGRDGGSGRVGVGRVGVGRDGGSGRVGVLVWNMTLDQTKASGDPVLARDVEVEVGGLRPGASYRLTHHRVDANHSNIASLWGRLKRPEQDWPDDDQWSALRAADRLDELEPARDVVASGVGVVRVAFELPMPGASLVELTPRG